jgi:hypothetical protein
MSKRDDVLQIAIQVAGKVDEEIENVTELMKPEGLASRAHLEQMQMLHAIFKMTSMSTLMQAAKLAIDMTEGK